MYVLAVRQASGSLQLEVGSAIEFHPKNGGWISLRQGNATAGWPLGQIESTKVIGPHVEVPMPEEEKENAVRDWLDNRMAERRDAGVGSDTYDMFESLEDVRTLIG